MAALLVFTGPIQALDWSLQWDVAPSQFTGVYLL